MTPMIDMNGDVIASWTSADQERVKRNLQKIRSMHNRLLSTTEADLYHAVHEIERLQTENEALRAIARTAGNLHSTLFLVEKRGERLLSALNHYEAIRDPEAHS